MTALQNDPYLLHGTPEVPQDTVDAVSSGHETNTKEEKKKQTYNPDDEETFYNAQNWVYGPDGTSIPITNEELATPSASPRANPTPQQTVKEEKSPVPPTSPTERATSKITFGWAPEYALPLFTNDIPSALHMRESLFPYMIPLGIFADYDLILKKFAFGNIGLCVEGTLHYYADVQEDDTAHFLYFALSALFLWEKDFGKNTLSLKAGLGAWFAHPWFVYTSIPEGLREEPTSIWAYPQAVFQTTYAHAFSRRIFAQAALEISPVFDVRGSLAFLIFPVSVHIGLGVCL